MTSKAIAAIIVAIAILGLVVGFWIFGRPKNNTPETPTPISQIKTTDIQVEKQSGSIAELPQATGKADDIASGISSQLQSEEDNFAGEDSDANLGVDQAALNDLGQSYDENEF